MHEIEPKIAEVRKMISSANLDDKVNLEVDGGISVNTVSGAAKNGANVLIAGSGGGHKQRRGGRAEGSKRGERGGAAANDEGKGVAYLGRRRRLGRWGREADGSGGRW